MACSCGLAKEEEPIAVGGQLRHAALPLRTRRLRGQSAEHREFRGFCTEIDNVRRSACLLFPALPSAGRRQRGRYGHREAPRSSLSRHPRSENGAMRPAGRPRSFRREAQKTGRPVVAHDLQDPGAVENVDQFVLGMGLPMAGACPRGHAEKEHAVAVTRPVGPRLPCAWQASPASVSPRDIVSFAASALRSMMVGIMPSMRFTPAHCRATIWWR